MAIDSSNKPSVNWFERILNNSFDDEPKLQVVSIQRNNCTARSHPHLVHLSDGISICATYWNEGLSLSVVPRDIVCLDSYKVIEVEDRKVPTVLVDAGHIVAHVTCLYGANRRTRVAFFRPIRDCRLANPPPMLVYVGDIAGNRILLVDRSKNERRALVGSIGDMQLHINDKIYITKTHSTDSSGILMIDQIDYKTLRQQPPLVPRHYAADFHHDVVLIDDDEEEECRPPAKKINIAPVDTSSLPPLPPSRMFDMRCVVCRDAERCILFNPCHHVAICDACLRTLAKSGMMNCPVCRSEVLETEKMIFV